MRRLATGLLLLALFGTGCRSHWEVFPYAARPQRITDPVEKLKSTMNTHTPQPPALIEITRDYVKMIWAGYGYTNVIPYAQVQHMEVIHEKNDFHVRIRFAGERGEEEYAFDGSEGCEDFLDSLAALIELSHAPAKAKPDSSTTL